LRMGVIDCRASGLAVILENEDVAKALVVFQVQHAIPITPEHVLPGTFGKRGERRKMVRGFNYDFVRADSIHLVKETFAFAVQFAFDAQSGKFIWHHADAPTRRVWASAVPSVDENFRRCARLIAHAEGAILLFSWDDTLAQEVVRPLPSVRRHNHPSTRDWIFTQLRQSNPPRTGCAPPLRPGPLGTLNCTFSGVSVKMSPSVLHI